MRRVTTVLAITTAVFAATTAYFANALRIERDRVAPPVAIPASSADAGEAPVALPLSVPASMDSPTASVQVRPQRIVDEDPAAPRTRTERRIADSQARLLRFSDPTQRAEIKAIRVRQVREESFRMAKHLGLSGAELDSLAELIAEQGLRRQESIMRCDVDPRCTARPADLFDEEVARQEVEGLLGRERGEKYVAYMSSLQERRQVDDFRARLSVTRGQDLSEAQADRLIAVMADEGKKVTETAKLRGVRIRSFVSSSGQLRAAGEKDATDPGARLLESAAEYIHHVHDRAAEILTPAQLADFDEIQEGLLRQWRERCARSPRGCQG